MSRVGDDGYRESIWGIDPRDRPWFQVLTLAGGVAGFIILTLLELDSLSVGGAPSEAARNIVLGIGASFVSSGFIAWGILQAKDLIMPAGDILRRFAEKQREKWYEESRQQGIKEGREQGRAEGREQGRAEGRLEALREIYGPDYSESQEETLTKPPDSDKTNGASGNNGDR